MTGDDTTIGRVEGRQLLGMGWVSRILQQIVAAWWGDPTTRERLATAERTYSVRRSALIQALADRGIHALGRSGLNVTVPVADEALVASGLLSRGWAVTALERWRIHASPAIRVTTATLAPDEARTFADDVAYIVGTGAGRYTA
jgi:DNA-binding transcriptional MocR family regulator